MTKYIIYLDGITLDDYDDIADQFDNRLMEETETFGSVATEYDKIPLIITRYSEWPVSTNLQCWNCDFTFSNRPVYIPLYIKGNVTDCLVSSSLTTTIEERFNNVEIGIKGNFCTFGCAVNYVLTIEKGEYYANLILLYSLITGKRASRLIQSPSKYIMKKYGGDVSEDEYIKMVNRTDLMHVYDDYTEKKINNPCFVDICKSSECKSIRDINISY